MPEDEASFVNCLAPVTMLTLPNMLTADAWHCVRGFLLS
jgi:hypothetical protein